MTYAACRHRVVGELDAALGLVSETAAKTYEPFIREQAARLRHDEAKLREAFVLDQQVGAIDHARRPEAQLWARQGGA